MFWSNVDLNEIRPILPQLLDGRLPFFMNTRWSVLLEVN